MIVDTRPTVKSQRLPNEQTIPAGSKAQPIYMVFGRWSRINDHLDLTRLPVPVLDSTCGTHVDYR